ncbi:ABC transporter substrate-binding protein [Pseudooceanicola sp. CBS1P-1]|uniref:Peptide ABC transporter substrate-binding protein n=1 Tax=Pseudooceanicola albus TaxID=2692189 RepID=A0A6L7G520_9RHOB|nr:MULTISPECIES: ABC transporter substrate-binding protein [Pseudooceanicola]MBT9385359.1 ABC transporter substrate-binding protein [Pseudooceanicola endophyticus]MXN18782.1 peptide ABC transporter substrate-binding protein [Pseudooceanicola albus]
MDKTFRLNRRGFLASTAAMGAGLMLAPGLAQAAEPKQGGTFRLGIGDFSPTDTMDVTSNDTKFYNIAQLCARNCLIEIAPDGSLIPELAESWGSDDTAKVWTFKLRSGVTFHSGKTLDAQDVVFTLGRHLEKGTTSGIKPFLEDVETFEAAGPLEVKITLKNANVDFPAILATPNAVIVADGNRDPKDGNGTGPYILENWQPGVSASFKKNPNYWKEGRAHFDAVELIGIADPSARTSALIGGKIDAYNQVDLKTVKLLKAAPTVNILSVSSKAHYCFPMMMDMDPFTNQAVVDAMRYGINRQDMVDRILNGYGTVGNDQPINASYRYFNADLPQREYDPEKAKSLLKKAGMDHLAVTLNVSEVPFSGATDAAVLYKEHAKAAGIDIDVKRVPDDSYWDKIWTHVPLCATRWSGRLTEDIMIGGVYTTSAANAGWNETAMKDPQLDELVIKGRSELNEDKRRQMYYDMQEIIRDRGSNNIFAFANFTDATTKKVATPEKLGNDRELDSMRAPERWWFA